MNAYFEGGHYKVEVPIIREYGRGGWAGLVHPFAWTRAQSQEGFHTRGSSLTFLPVGTGVTLRYYQWRKGEADLDLIRSVSSSTAGH